MKIYLSKFSPNPRRVVIYLREKGLEDKIETQLVDMLKREHKSPPLLDKNPLGQLPILELDDGRYLTESMAICQYLDTIYPEPELFGDDPWQRALTQEATRIAELGLLVGASLAFQNTSPFFANTIEQSEATADFGRAHFTRHLERIDGLLATRTWLAGDRFTFADITAIAAIDFGEVSSCKVGESFTHVRRWLDAVRQRPSCQRGSSKNK